MNVDFTKSALNFNVIRDNGIDNLVKVFKSMPGEKVLILDPHIIGPLNLVAASSLLNKYQVAKLYKLNDQVFDLPTDSTGKDLKNVMYIVRPRLTLMSWITKQVKYLREKYSTDVSIYVYLVPRKTLICEKVLKDSGIYSDIRLNTYTLDLIPFDFDVLSMELPLSFKECNLQGDLSSLYYVAKSIMKLQQMFGIIPHIKAAGPASHNVLEMMLRMKRKGNYPENSPEIDSLILFDRKIDLISPLFVQLTYEGLIDEFFEINDGCFQPPFDCVPGAKKDTRPKVVLNSSDSLFSDIRDLNLMYVGQQIKKKSTQIESEINEKNELHSAERIREYKKKLPRLVEEKKNWEVHLRIVQEVNELISKRDFKLFVEAQQSMIINDYDTSYLPFIEELINKQESITKVLRLICLASITGNGLKAKTYDFLKREIVQTYGYEALLTLRNLEQLGMLKKQESSWTRSVSVPWTTIQKELQLVKEDMDPEQTMNDIHAVHSGYSPLSVVLCEQSIKQGGWKSIKNVIDLLPGPFREIDQTSEKSSKKIILVFFIGGITMAEISAFRYLNKRNDDFEYVIVTTKLINGNNFMENLYEYVGNIQKRTYKPPKTRK